MAPAQPPPSPQEIHRKLSTSRPSKPLGLTVPISGTESDSDSMMSPDVLSPSSHPLAVSGSLFGGSVSQPPLSSIAEPGEDSEDEIDENEVGGWKTGDVRKKKNKSIDESVLKAGYLWKKGERRKTWKKRWFVLRPAHLAYYKTEAEYQLLRLLELADVHSCTQIALKRHENTFGLVSPLRTFYLQASNQADVQSWVKAIESARQTLMTTSTRTSIVSPPTPPMSAPIAIPSSRARSGSTRSQKQSQLTPSPPRHSHNATSSDSDDGSPGVQRTYSTSPSRGGPTLGASPTGAITKDPTKNVLAGYLMKCGSKRRNWRKRWFVLTGEKLMYTASHMDTKPHRQFPFSDILDALEYDLPTNRQNAALLPAPGVSSPTPPAAASHVFDEADDAHRAHTFKIVTTKRAILLCAPSEEEEIKWLGAVRALIARKSIEGTAAVTPSPVISPTSSAIASGGGSGGLKAKVRRLSQSGGGGGSVGVSEGGRQA